VSHPAGMDAIYDLQAEVLTTLAKPLQLTKRLLLI
jgi:hypothetical protein